MNNKNKNCIICGKSLNGMLYRNTYCSKECYKKAKSWNKRKHKHFNLRKCLGCGREFMPNKSAPQKLYCSTTCWSKKYYSIHREDKMNYQKEYYKKNYDRMKKKIYSQNKNWRINNKEHYNELMKKNRTQNKEKYNSRDATWDVLNFSKRKNILIIEKKCKICGTEENLEIHHEIYPTKREEIRNALKEGKIFYLCKKHHVEREKEKRLKCPIF